MNMQLRMRNYSEL